MPKYEVIQRINDTDYLIEVTPDVRIFKPSRITLNADQYKRFVLWSNGTDRRMIQTVFPEMTSSEREILLSGVGDDDWDSLKPEEA